ncbi:MAG: L,D-transpeptidase [Actinomycetes bacterium]|jgi:lipoprotein-anchoring transpeptidase ErfK/SrfK|nr:L,D-transpeptidase [Actinomycetes bacterium]
MSQRFFRVKFASALLCVCVCAAVPALAAAAEPIKPGVVVTIATKSGLKKVKAGGLLPAELKAKLAKYTLKKAPSYLYFTERDYTKKVKTGDLKMKPSVSSLVQQASVAATDTAIGGKYVTAAAEKKLASRIKSLAKKVKVKAKSAKVAGGGKVKNLGGRTLDQAKALKAAVKALNSYGTGKAKKPKVLAAPIIRSKPKMTGRSGKGKVLVSTLTSRRVYLFKANKLVAEYGICIGMPGYATPTGTYRVARKAKNPTWRNPGAAWSQGMAESISGPYGPLGKRALYLTKNGRDIGIRFHGTYKSYSIDKAQSHGCMRLKNADIVKLYPKVPVGTLVTVVK